MILTEATGKQLEKWDDFIDNSVNGTIFHKIMFLRYHGDKFASGERFLVVLNGQEVYAQISLYVTEDENGRKEAKSPYGASYGGFVFKSLPTYKIGKETAGLLLDYLKSNNIESFKITQPSNFYCKFPTDTFIFNLLESGLISYSRDILNVFKMNPPKPVMELIENGNNRNIIRKAEKSGIVIKNDASIGDVYPLIEKSIGRFNRKPTHSFSELKWLNENFSDEIHFIAAYYNDKPIAAVTNFAITKNVESSFYISSDEEHLKLNAVRYTIYEALRQSKDKGFTYYDFGTSSVSMVGNERVFAIKEEFSKAGVFRETLKWEQK